ncbi:hypothetical protein MKY41_12930 [Sporosarcina sp. FSL W7-1349]|uniref:hypothetical protein n=1 Tax=Sporosarcina sp. FSL W7-1349 TaxID=2921561 RepID=UPI0030F5D027
MDFLKLRFYIELFSITLGLTGIFYIVPMQVAVEGQPRMLTVILLLFLWYVIFTTNLTFHELCEKWFKRK